MRDALERLDTLHPNLMIKFGGHAMAAGLSLEEAQFDEFNSVCSASWSPSGSIRRCCRAKVVSDGELAPAEMSMEVAQMLRDAGPWGQMFPEPLFRRSFSLAAAAHGGRASPEGDGRTGRRRTAAGRYRLQR